MQRYGLILGQGRSGTNWVVDTLDTAPDTFCRNEPHASTGSPMPAELPPFWLIGDGWDVLEERWDDVAERVATHMGERDHRINHPKTFVYPLAQRLGVAQASARPKIRQYASRVLRSWGTGEWTMPRWVGPGPASPDVLSILKFVQAYNWTAWVLRERPEVPVVHVVRHPGGRHDSFVRRYATQAGEEETRVAKIDQLRRIVDSAPEWGDRFGPLDDLSLAQAETWFGVYQMETLESLIGPDANYLRIVYEEMVFELQDTAERVFDHFGLDLPDRVRDAIEAERRTSVFGAVGDAGSQAHGWRDRLDPTSRAEIEEILDGSPIREWWARS